MGVNFRVERGHMFHIPAEKLGILGHSGSCSDEKHTLIINVTVEDKTYIKVNQIIGRTA